MLELREGQSQDTIVVALLKGARRVARMKAEALERLLASFCGRRPFRPFFIEMTSGRRFLIRTPESVAVRAGIAVIVRPDGGYCAFDAESVCHLDDPTHRRDEDAER